MFALLAALSRWREGQLWPYFALAAVLLLTPALLAPRVLRPIERAWMAVAWRIGIVSTTIILAVTFFVIITPIGCIRRLMGSDDLGRRFDKAAHSYWTPADRDGSAARPDKPY